MFLDHILISSKSFRYIIIISTSFELQRNDDYQNNLAI